MLLTLLIAVTAPRQPSGNPVAQATATPTEAPTPIDTPTPAPTAPPLATPAASAPQLAAPAPPTPGPHDLTEANVIKSIQDNSHEAVGLSNFDHMTISGLDTGHVVVTVQPDIVKDETRAVEIGAWDTWVISKATLGYYPAASDVTLHLKGGATDVNGQKSIEDYVVTRVSAGTAKNYDYSGLQDRITNCSGQMYTAADGYKLALYIWKNLDGKVRGCMPNGFVK